METTPLNADETRAAHAGGAVLIVEDDQSMAETLARALTIRGFTITWTTSADYALELLDNDRFDAVVTDLHMAGLDGLGLCRHVVVEHPHTPVVMITAFGTADTAIAANAAGAFAFITKPFEIEVLSVALARAVRFAKRGSRSGRGGPGGAP